MGIGLEEEEGKMCVSLSLSFEGCFFVRDVVGKSTSALFLSFFLSFFLCAPSPPGLGLGDERSIAAPAFGRMMSFS